MDPDLDSHPGSDQLSGDAAMAAEEIFRTYHHRITRLISSRFHPDLAEDVASAVYLKILEGKRPQAGRPVWPWLRVVAINKAIDLIRASHSDRKERLVVDLASPDDTEGQIACRVDLDRAMGQLRAVERDAVLALPTGFRPTDVALHHGRTVSAVHSITKRTKARLRMMLDISAGLAAAAALRIRRLMEPGMPNGSEVVVHAAAVFVLAFFPSSVSANQIDLEHDGRSIAVSHSSQVGAQRLHPVVARRAPHSPNRSDSQAVDPRQVAEILIETNSDAPTPRKIVVQQPTIDTPLGPAAGGRTEVECRAPGDGLMNRPLNWTDHC